jgi:hypothetical protein
MSGNLNERGVQHNRWVGRNREENFRMNELLLSCHHGLRGDDYEAFTKVMIAVLRKEAAGVIEASLSGSNFIFSPTSRCW